MRTVAWRVPMYYSNMSGAGTGSDTSGNGSNGTGNQGGNNQSGSGNNNNNQGGDKGAGKGGEGEAKGIDAFAGLWQPKAPKGGAGDGSGGNNNNNNNNNNSGGNNNNQNGPPVDRLGEYIGKKNYIPQGDVNKLKESFESRNWADFEVGLTNVLRNLNRDILVDAHQIGKNFADQATETAVNKSGNNFRAQQVENQMFDRHKELKNPAVAPVAKGVLGRFLGEGLDVDVAIQKTYDYFVAVGQTFFKAPPNSGGRGDPMSGDASGNGGGEGSGIKFDELFGPPS